MKLISLGLFFRCPECGARYTEEQCKTDFARVATVVCRCGCQMDVQRKHRTIFGLSRGRRELTITGRHA